MGCNGSKSAGTENQQKNTENKDEQKAGDTNQQQEGDKNDEVYVTEEVAIDFVKAELGVTEEKAKAIVATVNKNGDGKIADEEIKTLWEKVKAKRDEIKPIFAEYDKDGSGFVTQDEALQVMKKKFGEKTKEEHLKKMMGQWAKDDKIDYNDFVLFYAMACARKETMEKQFSALDADGDGFVPCKDVVKIVQDTLGVDERQASAIVQNFDQPEGKGDSGDNKISKQEFNNLFTALFA